MRNFVLLLFILCSTSCSVIEAARGIPEPDMAKLQPGEYRSDVERELGDPIMTRRTGGDVRYDTYHYTLGDSPSVGRAIKNLCLDILTLCLWEFVAYPEELSRERTHFKVTVQYDQDDIARYFHIEERDPAP